MGSKVFDEFIFIPVVAKWGKRENGEAIIFSIVGFNNALIFLLLDKANATGFVRVRDETPQ